MLVDTLERFESLYKKLWIELTDKYGKNNFIDEVEVSKATFLLENLIKCRIFQLPAFELLLKINPDRALALLEDRYLSMDLSDHINDQVSDLEIMLTNIKKILGKEQLINILNSDAFLAKNKKNRRVKEAIRFAKEDD